MKRIDVNRLTEQQIELLIPVIEGYIVGFNDPTAVIYQDDDLWISITDPETGLEYDLNLWVTDDDNQTMSVSMYNVVQSDDPQYMTTDTSSKSEQHIWSSCDWSFEDWKHFQYSRLWRLYNE